MTTRKTLRRVILSAAVSTTSMGNFVDSQAFGIESTSITRPSGIQRVQYQSGQTGGQPNSAVTQELNRMFQESGQPMPSMNPNELPNAQGQHSAMVRQKPITTQQPAKKNFLQRFIGKVSGKDRNVSEAPVAPPVPPDYRQPSSTPQAMPQQGTTGYAAQSVRSPGNAAPPRTAQVVPPNVQARHQTQPNRPVPAVPGAAQPGVASTVSRPAGQGTQQYVQPGTAPAFMPSSQVVQPSGRNTVQATVSTSPAAIREPIAAPPANDDFEDPFADSEIEVDTADDALDLDSLMVLPTDESTAAASLSTNEPVRPTESVPASSRTTATSVNDAADASPLADNPPEEAGVPEEMNPFTGVRLNETDAEFFGPDSAEDESGGGELSSTGISPSETSAESSGAPAPPMEDFQPDLPAINLPSVDEPTAESVSPSVSTPSTNPSGSDQPQPAAADKSRVAPLRSVDAERLEQAAEQDRRLRQQRSILSRAGQPGFKGLCPVELRDRRNLVDANPGLTAVFGLQTYTFSSLEAKAAFEADPSRYAPAAGGNDVVLLVNSGEEQAGMLDYALWYRDRLYLFRSRETMVLFNKDPGRFANQY